MTRRRRAPSSSETITSVLLAMTTATATTTNIIRTSRVRELIFSIGVTVRPAPLRIKAYARLWSEPVCGRRDSAAKRLPPSNRLFTS